ncbi:MAG: SIMPL domain-containing protein [Myxococcota bacterium]|nr:SIMPL domain-containing protein [Myxococcota bacterium]
MKPSTLHRVSISKISSLFLAFVLSAFAVPSMAQIPQRTVSVTGSAEVKVVPDTVIVSLTASNRGENLLKTQNENDAVVKQYLRFLRKQLKVKSQYVQTDHHRVSPEYYYCSGQQRNSADCDPLKVRFYTVTKSIQVRLVDPSKYETVIRKAFEMGVTRINGVQFVSTELRKHRDEARKLATIAAKDKAKAAADALGMKLLKPISINLTENRWGGSRSMTNNTVQNRVSLQSSGADSDGLALGQISISAEVRVSFEME